MRALGHTRRVLTRRSSVFVPLLLASTLTACGPDTVEVVPACDEIGWPLELEGIREPGLPEFPVECADGWGNRAETREALDTLTLPGWPWSLEFPADGGWIAAIHVPHLSGWEAWLESWAIESEAPLVRLDADGETPIWARDDIYAWSSELVSGQLWILARDTEGTAMRMILDPNTGETLAAWPWTETEAFNQITAAQDPAGGAWITAYDETDEPGTLEAVLFRTTDLAELVEVARRTIDEPGQRPFGNLEPLVDGGVAWRPAGEGFEHLSATGELLWSHAEGAPAASDETSILVTSRPAREGGGWALGLEQLALADGSSLWTREHRRFELLAPEDCSEDDCRLVDGAFPRLRPGGGYLVYGYHAYPSSTCATQPVVFAVSATGEVEWAHRVEVCGPAGFLGTRDGALEIAGGAYDSTNSRVVKSWVRRFVL